MHKNADAAHPTHEWRRLEKQKARGDLTPGARGDLTPTKVEKPGAICTPMPGAICTPLSRSRVDGRGLGGAEVLSPVPSVPPSSALWEASVPPPVSQPSEPITIGSSSVVAFPGRRVS